VRFPDEYLEDRKGILLASRESGIDSTPKDAKSEKQAKGRRVGSEDVCRELALRCGVVSLAGSFFMPSLEDEEVWAEVERVGGGVLKEDMWLR
jgi:hypothetical protein